MLGRAGLPVTSCTLASPAHRAVRSRRRSPGRLDGPYRTAGGPASPAMRKRGVRGRSAGMEEWVCADGLDCARGHAGSAEPPEVAPGSGSWHRGSAHAASRRCAWLARWAAHVNAMAVFKPAREPCADLRRYSRYSSRPRAISVTGGRALVVAGPRAQPWKGRNKARRQDRCGATAWSPEQIARRRG